MPNKPIMNTFMSKATPVDSASAGIDIGAVIVQRMHEAKSGIWLRCQGPAAPLHAAPNRTDTSFDTPGSCMVTP
jgi:hypothetical protein